VGSVHIFNSYNKSWNPDLSVSQSEYPGREYNDYFLVVCWLPFWISEIILLSKMLIVSILHVLCMMQKFSLSKQTYVHWNMNSSKDTSVTDIRTPWWWHTRSAETCRRQCIYHVHISVHV